MEKVLLNETPIRTSRNFNANNIKLENIDIPVDIKPFSNIKIMGESSKIKIENTPSSNKLTYGLGEILEKQIDERANQKYKLTIDSKTNKEIILDFDFNKTNTQLISDIQIIASENTKSTVILEYKCDDEEIEFFNNNKITLLAKENSNIDIIIVNLLNIKSNNFLSIENRLEKGAKAKYTIVDLGGKNSLTNYYSNLLGEKSDNRLDVIYLGKERQTFDLNYIGELRGEKTNIDIEVQGALKDYAKKHFKGTIDFKKGSKKATGNENETCILLSKTAKSLALPMLLCSEEDVEGNHSSSAGKIGEKELFYIMSRGFNEKEAMKIMIRAKFNKILKNIKNEELKDEILKEIDMRLD